MQIASVAFSAAGTLLATGGLDGELPDPTTRLTAARAYNLHRTEDKGLSP